MKTKSILTASIMLFGFTSLSLGSEAQQRRVRSYYNPHAAQAAYYQAYNQHTTPVYNSATAIKKVSDKVVNYGTRIVPGRAGAIIRNGYNQTTRYIQRRRG